MPSVNANKLEKQASTEAVDPIRQAIIVVEHKIRNLEKRKGKLEQYRDIVKNGGELNSDQKTAVAKYDEVQQTLDITKDLYKAINTIATDAIKQQKKLARKEAAERMQQDIAKVREVLLIQDTLMNMCAQGVREDFLNGTNGAIKLLEEDFQFLDSLYNEVMLKHTGSKPEIADPTFIQQAQKVAEHYVLIVEGKQREVVGTTYSKLKEIITSITQCGYFDQGNEVETPTVTEEITQLVAEVQISNMNPSEQISVESGFNNIEKDFPVQSQSESIISAPIQPCIIPPTMPISAVGTPFPVPTIPLPVTTDPNYMSMFPGPITPLPQQQPNQLSQQNVPVAGLQQLQPSVSPQLESRQDIISHHRSSISPPKINDVIGPSTNFCFLQDSELDHPEVSNTTTVSQTPAVVSHIPSAATVVAAAVSLNAPIPTQTYTNQSFAAPHVVPTPVMYPAQDLSHLPSFGNTNPPPPIPMPPSHQTSMQFSQQSMGGFPQQTQTFEPMKQQEAIGTQKEELHDTLEQIGNESGLRDGDIVQNNSSTNWADSTETTGEWGQESSQQSGQDLQKSQSWGDQPRNNFRGRGPRRGNSNGYRGRGNYQQNDSYYRSNNDGNNYQNGYQPRNNWNSNGDGNTSGYSNTSFKRSTSNQSRGGPPRGDRNNVDARPNRVGGGGNGAGGGQFRGSNQRGSNPRTNYAPRGGKPQTHN
ncbi:caprin homolog isoform X2 [Copidosoma floridanum]|uniref:caprin homolog isoform X2 n=1 Tax=Copidosoma floridanum TaxID=29053 RepID=UPI0006C9D3B7|nr:caprin homolog isoform X2 [Copidosoma floridanum]